MITLRKKHYNSVKNISIDTLLTTFSTWNDGEEDKIPKNLEEAYDYLGTIYINYIKSSNKIFIEFLIDICVGRYDVLPSELITIVRED